MHPAARRCSAPTSAPSRPWPARVRHPPRALFPKPGTSSRRVPPLRVVVRDRLSRGLLYVRHGLGCPNGAHVSRARAPRAGWWPNLDLRWSVGGRSHMGPPRALPVLGLWSRFFVMSASQHDPLSRTTRGSVGEGLKATLYAQTLISWDFTLPSSHFLSILDVSATRRHVTTRTSIDAGPGKRLGTSAPPRLQHAHRAEKHAPTLIPAVQVFKCSHHHIIKSKVLRSLRRVQRCFQGIPCPTPGTGGTVCLRRTR